MAFEWFMAFEALPTFGENDERRLWVSGHGGLDSVETGTGTASLTVEDVGGQRGIRGRNTNALWDKDVPSLSEIVVGFGYSVSSSSAHSTDKTIIELRDASASILRLVIMTTGEVQLRKGATVLEGNVYSFGASVRYFIELSARIAETDGDYTLRILGGPSPFQIDASDIDLGAGPVTIVRGGGLGSSSALGNGPARSWYGPMYIRERPVGQTGFLGPLAVTRLDHTSDILAEWTPDTGSDNFARAAGEMSLTGYLDSDTIGDRDEYEVDDLVGANSVIAVVRYSLGEAPEGGAPQIQHGLRRDTTEDMGEERTVGIGSPQTQITVFPTQPNGSPWSVAAVNEIKSIRESV
jgi:hypothetical protein